MIRAKEHKRHLNPSGMSPEKLVEVQEKHGKPKGSPGINKKG